MSQEHWRKLVRFAVAQDVRTPANLRTFLARHRDTMQKLMNETLETSVRHLEAAVKAGVTIPKSEPALNNPLPLKVSIPQYPEGDGRSEEHRTGKQCGSKG